MRFHLIVALFAAALAWQGAPAFAEESASGEAPPVAPPPPFQPPLLGAPGGRISAATRGEETRQDGILTLVAPLGGGLTASEQPVLVWHLAAASAAVLRVEIAVADQNEPWLVYLDEDGLAAGFHRLDLGSLGLRMPVGAIYRLRLSLGDAAAVDSFIERVPAEPTLAAALSAPATDAAALAALAAAGLWWDYIARLPAEAQLAQAAAEQGLALR